MIVRLLFALAAVLLAFAPASADELTERVKRLTSASGKYQRPRVPMLPSMKERMSDMRLKLEHIESPIGSILIAHDGKQICNLEFTDCEDRMQRMLARHFDGVEIERSKQRTKFGQALQRYFKGDVTAIDKLPVAKLGTPFQQRAWAALRRIPAGETRSYGQQARAIRAPNAARAVGLANHLNPIGIVVPCHRVRGADGSLTGYAGGLERKRWLIEHEARSVRRTSV